MAISIFSFFDELHQIKDSGGMGKVAKDLTEAARDKIKPKNFALTPGQSSTGEAAYPIHDRSHAANALTRVEQHGTPKQKAEVYKDVAKKYPDLARKSEVPELKARTKGKEKDGQGPGNFSPGTNALPGMVGGPPGGMGVSSPMGGVGAMGRPG